MTDVTTTTLTLTSGGSPMPTFVATPPGEARAGVVVVQEAFGLTGHIEQVAVDLADAGYVAVAPALFHRSGAPVFSYDDLSRIGPAVTALTGQGIADDVDAALAELERRGHTTERSGIVGFCMGGSIALTTAARRPLGGAVTFYGGGVTEGRFGLPALAEAAPDLRAPWLGLYGDLDDHIPVADVERLRTAAQAASVPTELVRYAEADHGFHCPDRASFHQASSSDAWRRTLSFFDEHLG